MISNYFSVLLFVSLTVIFTTCAETETRVAVTDIDEEVPSNIILSDLQGAIVKLDKHVGNTNLVLFFLSPECPLCQNYSLAINQIADEYASDSIKFVGVFPGEHYSKTEIKAFILKYKLKFDMWLDRENELCRTLGASITPEVCLIAADQRLKYRGAIDNWAVSLGRKRTVTTEFYLKDALSAIAGGKEIETKTTEAVGCLIEL